MKKIKQCIKIMGNGKAVNCFALNGAGKCRALKETSCHNCKFFKTEEQVQAERQATQLRLRKLNFDMSKYYEVIY